MIETFNFTSITLITDKYEGIIIDNSTIPHLLEDFEKEIVNILNNVVNKKLLWIKLPIIKSDFIPILIK